MMYFCLRRLFLSLKTVQILMKCRLDTGKQVLSQTMKIQMKCCIRRHSSGSALFSKIKIIFRDRNTSFYRNLTSNPLKNKIGSSILIVSICFGYFIRMKRVNLFPIGIMGQVWYLIVSIPDLCTLTYFN